MSKQQKQQTNDKKKKKVLIGLLCGFGALAITAGITAPLLMCHPTQKILVTFASSEQGVTITPSSVEVEPGTTFGMAKSKVLASKVTGNTQWLFQYWFKSDDESKAKISDGFVINEPLNVSPIFEELSEDDLIVNFTPGEGDTNVEISTQSKTIKKGTTFIQIYEDVTAKKIVDGVEWEFKWWYKDGDEPTRKMSNDAVIDENITVHPYFVAPPVKEKVTLNFVEGSQEAGEVTIHSSGGRHFVVDKYTSFGSIIEKYEITAERSDGAVFQYWAVDPFIRDEKKDWIKPIEVTNELEMTNDILNVYPYFATPDSEWTDKTVIWEERQIDEETFSPLPKDLIVNKAPQVNTYKYKLSNFLLCDPNGDKHIHEGDQPIELDQDDEVSVEFTNLPVEYGSIFKQVKVVEPETSQALNRLNVELEFDTTDVEITPEMEPLSFGLKFTIKNDKFQKTVESTIDDFMLTINNPEPEVLPLEVQYKKPEKINDNEVTETFETAPGYKSVSIDSSKRYTTNGYFVLSREIRSDEKLEVIVEGENADNLQTTNLHIVNQNNLWFVDFDIGFKKIDGIGTDHIAEFKLKFVVTVGSLSETTVSEIPDTFALKFVHDSTFYPYAIVMDNVYTNNPGGNEINFDVDIENIDKDAKPTYFKKGDFLTVNNVSRRTDNDPVWFSAPSEENNPFIAGTSPIIPLEGQDVRQTSLRMNFYFPNGTEPPTTRKEYKVHLRFDFWKDDPSKGEWINKVEKDVTFVYDPEIPLVYSNDLWAQAHSVGIVQKAVNIRTQKTEETFGTGWILSYSGGTDEVLNLVTAYDIKREYLEFEKTNKYENHTIGITFNNVSKKYVNDDNQNYIILDDGSEFISELEYDNNDVIELYIHPNEGWPAGWQWDDDLSWKRNRLFGTDYIGPNMAVAKINFGGMENSMSNEVLYSRYYKNFLNTLKQWAEHDLPATSVARGQLTGIYNPTDYKDFDKTKYSYGFVGGFDAKEVVLPSGIKTNVFYWKSFDRPLGDGQIDLIGTTTYYLFCSGDGESLGQSQDGEEIIHRCPAFTLISSAFSDEEYFGPAGRGALFLLRPNDPTQARTLLPPIVAGINWNGYSLLNIQSHITPYFDCFAYDSQRDGRNLLAKYI